ncbi:MAG: TRADD-N-associated membrane domain-containing protein [Candidatus Electronema sp. V4]|uniref:TRADD-N-associated membrane domain-containing protein n=1 Tax=Candidatus Electronema sp. V4 TaxID=3454756 RepID=UPI004055429E
MQPIAGVIGVVAGVILFVVSAYQDLLDQRIREGKIEIVEERFREHPEKPQFAWDLARSKLENYLDRNLSQVRSIYWLTLLVMLCGFGFVLFGLSQAAQQPDKLPVSIVASASGVIISFIGGSFLLIYRSILAQSKEYVTVLERINAVGMAVQVIASIPDSNGELKHSTTADLAKQLLNLYAVSPVTRSVDEPSKSS